MAHVSCLAEIESEKVPAFIAALKKAGAPVRAIMARLEVVELGKLAPALLVCDVDGLQLDALELLRQLRFVLPACIIVVYTASMKRSWALACHLAGANGLLSKKSNAAELVAGVRSALRHGCFTDPRFRKAALSRPYRAGRAGAWPDQG